MASELQQLLEKQRKQHADIRFPLSEQERGPRDPLATNLIVQAPTGVVSSGGVLSIPAGSALLY